MLVIFLEIDAWSQNWKFATNQCSYWSSFYSVTRVNSWSLLSDVVTSRIRKGKACADDTSEVFLQVPGERLNRPLIRSLHPEPVESTVPPSVVSIPPPPAKHKERERFFKEKQAEGTTLPIQMRGLSLHSRNGNSSCNGSTDSTEWAGRRDDHFCSYSCLAGSWAPRYTLQEACLCLQISSFQAEHFSCLSLCCLPKFLADY